ncbi:UNVERIFIED_CONTAM: hypothetical protein NCL1_28232 [Trichonephila clavipes]
MTSHDILNLSSKFVQPHQSSTETNSIVLLRKLNPRAAKNFFIESDKLRYPTTFGTAVYRGLRENIHKNTSWPNNPSKCSQYPYPYIIKFIHMGKKQQKNIFYNFPKRKRDGVKHTRSKIANERLK